MDDLLERMRELNPEATYPTGMEKCIVGIGYRSGQQPIFIISSAKCIEHYQRVDGMSEEEAREFFEFNTQGAWMGEGTPIFMEE